MKKRLFLVFALLAMITTSYAQSPIGKWKLVSYITTYDGTTFDSHKALLKTRPCAAKIFYEINANGTYRLNASQSGCDASYVKIQEKLHSEEVWTLNGNLITIGHKKAPKVGHTYTVSFKGNTMIWVGKDGEGTLTYQRVL